MIISLKIYVVLILLYLGLVEAYDRWPEKRSMILPWMTLITAYLSIVIAYELIMMVKEISSMSYIANAETVYDIIVSFVITCIVFSFIYFTINCWSSGMLLIPNEDNLSNKEILLNCFYFSVSNAYMNTVGWIDVRGNLVKTMVMLQMVCSSIFMFYLLDKILESDLAYVVKSGMRKKKNY